MSEEPRGAPRRRAATVIASVGFVTAATFVQLWRVPGEHVWRTVWFEDATVFYRDALHLSLAESITKPYNGYAHALPRLLAEVGSWLPPEWYSAWAAASSTFVVSLLALFLYFASAPLLHAPIRQAILAASLLVLPVLSLEVLAALCNLQWYLLIACVFAVLFPVEQWSGIVVRAVIVVVAALTSPLSILLVPIALYQLITFLRLRDMWRRFVVPVLYLGASMGQLLVYLHAEHHPIGDGVQPPLGSVLDDIAELYSAGVVLYGGLDTVVSTNLWISSPWPGWVAAALVSALLLVKLRRARPTARWWIAGFALASVAVFVFTMVQRSERIEPALSFPPTDSRYWVAPQFLLLVALLVPPVVDRGLLVGSAPGSGLRVAATDAGRSDGWAALTGGLPWVSLSVLTVAWLALAVVPSYREVARSTFPSWPDEVKQARAACRVDSTTPQILDVVPPIAGAGSRATSAYWRLRLTCVELGVATTPASTQREFRGLR